MGWFDHQEKSQGSSDSANVKSIKKISIKLPGEETEFIEINKNQIKRIYADDLGGALLIIVDEVAELLLPSGIKSESGKAEDALKQECVQIIQSITQLGRSAGIHMLLATQRNDAKILPGVIQNNPINTKTELKVKRKVK